MDKKQPIQCVNRSKKVGNIPCMVWTLLTDHSQGLEPATTTEHISTTSFLLFNNFQWISWMYGWARHTRNLYSIVYFGMDSRIIKCVPTSKSSTNRGDYRFLPRSLNKREFLWRQAMSKKVLFDLVFLTPRQKVSCGPSHSKR